MTISGHTKVYAVVGHPVRHSLSPLIHNLWIETHGLDAVYVPLELESDAAVDDLTAFHRAGLAGLNITLPHKLAALSTSVDATDIATRIGAANTLTSSAHGWAADNTDVYGFAQALDEATGQNGYDGARVLMIGAGGAARAAVCALYDGGADMTIINRSVDKAAALASDLANNAQVAFLTDLKDFLEKADIVVNATSMGHSGGQSLDLGKGDGRLFYDLSYGKAADSILSRARDDGWRTEDGLRMLVEQARASFRIWNDIDPDPKPALEACRKALGVKS